MKSRKIMVLVLTLATVSLIALGCQPKPTKELADAEAALQEAKVAGAEQYAPDEYRSAEDLIRQAKDLMARGRNTEARRLLEQAKIKADEAKWKAISAKEIEEIEKMRELELAEEELAVEKFGPGQEVPGALQDIFFDYDRFNVRPDAQPALIGNSEYLRQNPDIQVAIEGWCDERGTEEYNLALGQRRADATKSYLIQLGVESPRLQAVSRGETTKWAEGQDEWAWQQNRRAHFIGYRAGLPPGAMLDIR